MFDVTTALILGALLLLVFYFWFTYHSSKYPPCPIKPWPILGHLFLLDPDPRKQFAVFRKKCGDLFSVYLGTTHVVIVNGYDMIKEAYVKRGDEFSDKAVIFMDIALEGVDLGVAAANGQVWKENRTLAVNILRNFGMGKNIMAHRVQEEIDSYMELLESLKGEARDLRMYNMVTVSNVMCSMIVGKRFDYEDEQFKRLIYLLDHSFAHVRGTALLNYFPSLRHLPGDLFKFKVVTKGFQEFLSYFSRAHFKENENVTGEAENFIAIYMQEIRKKEAAGEKSHIDRQNLVKCIFDLFAGGTLTSSTTISWFMLQMLSHPDVQEKAFKELEEHVGLQRQPIMADKPKLTYFSAVMMEVQRLADLVPMLLPREIMQTTTLGGYTLPKGSQIMINMNSVLSDKSVWGEDADKFRPERFLDDNGRLKIPDQWLPFSLGRRVCMGEGMAKMELFMYMATLLQRFKMLPEDPKSIPSLEGIFGILHVPKEFKIRLVSRRK